MKSVLAWCAMVRLRQADPGAMAAVVALPIALNFVGLGKVTDILLRVARWPLLLVIVAVMLAVIYRYGPSRTEARWRWVSWGGAIARNRLGAGLRSLSPGTARISAATTRPTGARSVLRSAS